MKTRTAAARGFTLIEVMIVVAIVGILAAVALPSYTSYMRRGELPEAFTQLSVYRMTMEQYYQDNRSYGSGTTCAGGAITTPASAKYFTFACTLTNSGQGYTLTATGNAGYAVGYDYTVDHQGQKYTTKYEGTSYTTEKPCWLSKSSDC